MSQTLSELQSRFPILNVVAFEGGPGGLVRAVITSPLASAVIYTHGAHVALWQPSGERPVLFMSGSSLFNPGKAIRGGVPICFPWFGPRAGDPGAPVHGWARVREWAVESVVQQGDGAVKLVFSLREAGFGLAFEVTVGKTLTMALSVTNESAGEARFEEALHTYFAVGDVREVAITGLAGVTFIDKTDGMKRKVQGSEPIRITAETDRVYVSTQSSCAIDDIKNGRRIIIDKSGSDTTVVWNPWIAKAKAMPDFGDAEWPMMVCIETANAAENAVRLPAGRTHRMESVVRVER